MGHGKGWEETTHPFLVLHLCPLRTSRTSEVTETGGGGTKKKKRPNQLILAPAILPAVLPEVLPAVLPVDLRTPLLPAWSGPGDFVSSGPRAAIRNSDRN